MGPEIHSHARKTNWAALVCELMLRASRTGYLGTSLITL